MNYALDIDDRILETITADVLDETERAKQKFGHQDHLTNLEWFAVLAEEFGEVAGDITKTCVPPITHPDITDRQLRNELVQVAATAMRMIATMDRRYLHSGKRHA